MRTRARGRTQEGGTGMFVIPWGVKARDKVTGMEGIVTGRCEHLTGCNTIGLTKITKDGDKYETFWFDETRLEVIDPTPVMERPIILEVAQVDKSFQASAQGRQVASVRLGGPQDVPTRSNPNPS